LYACFANFIYLAGKTIFTCSRYTKIGILKNDVIFSFGDTLNITKNIVILGSSNFKENIAFAQIFLTFLHTRKDKKMSSLHRLKKIEEART